MELLKLAGVASAGVAVLHLVIIFLGAPAYRYFGAGERMAWALDWRTWSVRSGHELTWGNGQCRPQG